MTNRLVFGDDASPAADLAWLWINSHEWADWQLEVVTAQQPELANVGAQREDVRVVARSGGRRPFRGSSFGSVELVSVAQDPRIALSRPADLLVIGPRGPGLAKTLHLGSTAEWLMSKPPSPMVIVRHGRRTEQVVVCHDGSAHAQAAAEAVAAMPWVRGTAVTVVSVEDGSTSTEAAIRMSTAVLEAAGAVVDHRVLPSDAGNVVDALRGYLDHHPVDLVALGTRGLTGLKRVVVGSTAAAIAHRSDHTVLLACRNTES